MRIRLRKVLGSVLVVCGTVGALLVLMVASVGAGLPPYPYFTRGSLAGAASPANVAVAIVAAGVAVAAIVVTTTLQGRSARRATPAPVTVLQRRQSHKHQRKAA
jgi:hypothetical protein